MKFELRENVGAVVLLSGVGVTSGTTEGLTGAGEGEAADVKEPCEDAVTGPDSASGAVAAEREAGDEAPSIPEMALPGCCEYQNPPATSSSKAAIPT